MTTTNIDNVGQLERDFMKVLETEHTVGTQFSDLILQQFYELYYHCREHNSDCWRNPTTDDEKYQACIEYKHSLFFQHYIVNSELITAIENDTITDEYKGEIIGLLSNITEFQESIYNSIQHAWILNDPYLHTIYNGDVTAPLPETNTDIFQVIRFLMEYGYHLGWYVYTSNDETKELSWVRRFPLYACHNDNPDYYELKWTMDTNILIKIYDDCFKYDLVEDTKMYAMTAYTDWFSADAPTIFRQNYSRIDYQEFLTKHPEIPRNSR
jgi:hypothetical protein